MLGSPRNTFGNKCIPFSRQANLEEGSEQPAICIAGPSPLCGRGLLPVDREVNPGILNFPVASNSRRGLSQAAAVGANELIMHALNRASACRAPVIGWTPCTQLQDTKYALIIKTLTASRNADYPRTCESVDIRAETITPASVPF